METKGISANSNEAALDRLSELAVKWVLVNRRRLRWQKLSTPADERECEMKIAILGYSGSGKSTLAKRISEHYGIPLLYLDTVQFEANWAERNREEALSMVAEFMDNQEWVIDGNYTYFWQSERLEQADYIIYMDFPCWNCLLRAYRRYRDNKNTVRESIADGCHEKMDLEFIWWILFESRTKKKKQQYDDIFNKHHQKLIILKNQKALDRFLINLFDNDPFANGRKEM